MVPRRGDAPRSPAYRAGALLLSYGGMKLAEHQRIALWTLWGRSGFQDRFLVYAGRAPSLKGYPHQDSNLEPPPLEAARADSPLHLVGF